MQGSRVEELFFGRPLNNGDSWQPQLLIPIGKLAISQLITVNKLVDVVGHTHTATLAGREVDVIALPHPSGLSTWHRTEPGKTLLTRALRLIKEHPAWCRAFAARLECKPNE